ncbi:hypothetical protein Droror1_Dr00024004 [Drosera rotundifolia]
MMEAATKGFWGKNGLKEVLMNNSRFYLFKIQGVHAISKVLEEDLTCSNYSSGYLCGLSFTRFHSQYGPVMDLMGLPTLYADSFTENMTRLDFARVYVEVDVAKQLPDKVLIKIGVDQHEIRVKYQWKPQMCDKCGVFGHRCKVANQE